MDDDDFISERPLVDDGRDAGNVEIQGSNIICEVWPNRGLTGGIECRLCSRFDLDGLANTAFVWHRGRIPDEQGLAVGIILVHGNRELPGGSLASLINEAAQRLRKLHAGVLLARELDLLEPGIPFLAAQRL